MKGSRIGSVDAGKSRLIASKISDVKPRILESKISENIDFYNLSDGFKHVFAEDKTD